MSQTLSRIVDLARIRQIGVVPVTELFRWQRSAQDLLNATHGRNMTTMLARIAQIERDLFSDRVMATKGEDRIPGVSCRLYRNQPECQYP